MGRASRAFGKHAEEMLGRIETLLPRLASGDPSRGKPSSKKNAQAKFRAFRPPRLHATSWPIEVYENWLLTFMMRGFSGPLPRT